MCEMLWTDPQDQNGRGPSKRVRRPLRFAGIAKVLKLLTCLGRRHRLWARHHASLDGEERGDGRDPVARGPAGRVLGRAQRAPHHRLLLAQLRRPGREPRRVRDDRRHGRDGLHHLPRAAPSGRQADGVRWTRVQHVGLSHLYRTHARADNIIALCLIPFERRGHFESPTTPRARGAARVRKPSRSSRRFWAGEGFACGVGR